MGRFPQYRSARLPQIRRIARRLVRSEDGVALVFALALTLVLALTTAGVLIAGTTNQRTSLVSVQARQAFATAQEALAYDEGMIYNAGVNGTAPPTTLQNLPTQPGGATGTYYASTADGRTWHLVATGTVGTITRTVTADATPPSSTTITEFGVWNYLYEDNPNPPQCISGGTTVSVPILTRGNFCMSGGSWFTGTTLEIGGNLLTSGGSHIGTQSSPITALKIAGTPSSSACSVNGGTATPGTGACDGSHNQTYAHTVGTTLDVTPIMPTVDFPGAYHTQAGLTKTGCPTNLLDNDSELNNSDNQIGNVMFGNTAYDCKIGSSNEIKWTPSTSSLYVNGTIYFDGSLSFTKHIQYTGQASLYFTGGVNVSGGGQLCGIANCTQYWDPDANGIIMVAACWNNSTGSQLITNGCVNLSGGSQVQFGVYVTTNYNVSGGSVNMGPVLSDTFTLSGGTNILIPFHHYPPGTPLSSTTEELPGTPPTNWSG